MSTPIHVQRELRYGAPVCDEMLIGRYFTIGYSWYFRQAKWVLEIVNPNDRFGWETDRADCFRADIRIPRRFRAGLNAYKGSGYDRGHLAASANHDELAVQNSETFLLSNMSPQKPELNRGMWRKLELAIRELNNEEDVLETYVLTAPVFYFDRKVETIGDKNDEYGINVPIPHAFVKSVLAEDRRGKLRLWTFEMENKALEGDIKDYLVVTYDVEQRVGGRFWDRVAGEDLHEQKKAVGKMWKTNGEASAS
ncbi:MAG: DNA/RNA endonuclease G [Planctomycetes bacterium]|nr:DNA/RNA endonuclease G [Planctomycetota bacterium]